MTTAVRISDKLARDARLFCRVESRSITAQINTGHELGNVLKRTLIYPIVLLRIS